MSSVRTQLCYSSACFLELGLLDFKNAFQNTLVPIAKRVIVTLPPKFLAWYHWHYPEYLLPSSESGKYATQIQRGIQGDCEVGRMFYILLKLIIKAFNMKQCPFESVLYFYVGKNGEKFVLNTTTDNLLCSFSTLPCFVGLRNTVSDFLKLPRNVVRSSVI